MAIMNLITVDGLRRKVSGLTVLIVLGLSVPANAHCYRFWFYRTPQNCGARMARVVYRDHPVRLFYVLYRLLLLSM